MRPATTADLGNSGQHEPLPVAAATWQLLAAPSTHAALARALRRPLHLLVHCHSILFRDCHRYWRTPRAPGAML
eukprot:16448986-Heterocapsa_arctica.AAC.1